MQSFTSTLKSCLAKRHPQPTPVSETKPVDSAQVLSEKMHSSHKAQPAFLVPWQYHHLSVH